MPATSCRHCGSRVKFARELASIGNCPQCGSVIAFVPKRPTDDIQFVERPAQLQSGGSYVPARSAPAAKTAQSQPADNLSQLAVAVQDPPARRVALVSRTNRKQIATNKIIVGLIIWGFLMLVVGVVGWWVYDHPYLEISDSNGKVMYKGRPARADVASIRQQYKEEQKKDIKVIVRTPGSRPYVITASPE